MSDAGRKMDVEDVLSSIRRLVSEEARTAHGTDDSAKTEPESDPQLLHDSNEEGPDKLVLTPSLRVPEAISTDPGTADIEQRIADIESLVMSEAVTFPMDSISANVEVQDVEEAPMESDVIPMGETEFLAEITSTSDVEAHTAPFNSDPVTEFEFAKTEPPLSANISQAPSEPIELHAVGTDFQSDPVEAALETDFLNSLAQDIHSLDVESVEVEMAEPVAEHFEEGEFAVSNVEENPTDVDEVNDVEADDYNFPEQDVHNKAASTESKTDTLSTSSIVDREPLMDTPQEPVAEDSEPVRSSADHTYDDAIDFTNTDDAFMDEESLREMVSEMVRSELQGELGDRITRNVRKLVRREIHRALASRDFE